MSRIIVIGGSGHIGAYLIPALVEHGHDVVNISRDQSRKYRPHPAWRSVEQVTLDRMAEERSGRFASCVVELRPDIVVDLISFDLPSTQSLVHALRGKVEHFLHCGTIWVYGHNAAIPADEDDPPNPFGEYGINKAAIEAWLLHESRRTGFPATVFRPGHIVGPGWTPIGPCGNVDIEVFSRMARGEEISLPNYGLETLHHVHADDIAQFVMRAIANQSASVGEAFNVVAEKALNLRGYAEAMFRWFGVEPKIRFQPFDEWKTGQTPEQADQAWEHIARSSCMSMEKARRRLGYQPRYTSLAAIQEAVLALIAAGDVQVGPITDAHLSLTMLPGSRPLPPAG
ncbi:NAD(P)-dependent oxidoreductase [Rhodanobacter glycinis]|uniref:NAD(P)-dependent oxidoreductase n=1 Tax=Rhodanobacter glycinis TaxID=582702 RepID=A0A502CFF0_9GAMM|nr:NAD(P)-dependent oxidoreductase [Rhodanobacter glycinis]TPG11432.1 NAD(P)-dependent oxidoreductase [Rhodanobacter glycinis]TPG46849.1 NAD(P)-dependent oxidoreductase [Rhodanobacter glycinis]